MEIGFIGLGKLGSECAKVMAEKHNVYGYDIAEKEVEGVKICDKIEDTVIGKDFTFIAVSTPHHKDYDGSKPTSFLPVKDFDYSMVIDVLKQIQNIKSDSIITLISTVLPGTIRREFRKYINPYRFIYNPYLIAMGTVEYDMKNPEMIIIGNDAGEKDKIEKLISFYQTISNCDRYIIGTWDEAESIKIFYNTFISMKLAFTNMILDVAEANGNIDADVVMKALTESTMRIISPMYMKAGMGDGGPCHPRDNIALSSLARRLGLGYDLFKEIMHSRERQAENLALKLMSYGNPIVILGKSYKSNVNLIDGSYSMLVNHYIDKERFACYYDKEPSKYGPFTYLLGHRHRFNDYDFIKGSVIVDPWGECLEYPGCELVRYGRTRFWEK